MLEQDDKVDKEDNPGKGGSLVKDDMRDGDDRPDKKAMPSKDERPVENGMAD